MNTTSYVSIGRRNFRVTQTPQGEIFISTSNRHGPTRSIDPNSELGQTIVRAFLGLDRPLTAADEKLINDILA